MKHTTLPCITQVRPSIVGQTRPSIVGQVPPSIVGQVHLSIVRQIVYFWRERVISFGGGVT